MSRRRSRSPRAKPVDPAAEPIDVRIDNAHVLGGKTSEPERVVSEASTRETGVEQAAAQSPMASAAPCDATLIRPEPTTRPCLVD